MTNDKWIAQPVGVEGAPWPSMERTETQEGNKTVTSYEVTAIEDSDDPLILHSKRPYPEVMGEIYRGMPVRDMLPAFQKIIHHANPDQNNRIIFLASDPGFGKSYLGVLVGKARDARGPIVVDVGGKNLESLLFKTVFNTEESGSLTKTIDKALAEDKLDPLSIKALKKLGKHASERFGRLAVDWKGLADDDKISHETITSVLDSVKSIEKWDSANLGIGFKVEKGPLVIAHEQGRDIVIDEMDKCKEGSEAPLQLVWQVLNGEIAQHTVTLGSLGDFTFHRGGTGLVMLTGNLPKDGKASHLISESFDRRAPRFEIPTFSEGSWTDITAKILTGLPIPLLHEITPGEWKAPDVSAPTEKKWTVNDSEAFTKKLFELSTLGMNDEDRRKLKEWQLSQIANWENVLDASHKLGEFYHKWGQLVDPDSQLMKTGKFSDIMAEIEDPLSPTLKITPSTMIRHVEAALIPGPKKKPADKSSGFSSSFNWNEPVPIRTNKEAVEESFGTRMIAAIMDEVYRTSAQAGKKELYTQLMADAKAAGLVGNPPPLAAKLNIDPTKVKGTLSQAKREQNLHAALLRKLFPDHDLSANDEDILPLRSVQAALEQMERNKMKPEVVSPFTNAIIVPNTDLEAVQGHMYERVATDNKDSQETLQAAKKRLPASKLLNVETLLSTLAMQSVGGENLDMMWNKSITQGTFSTDEPTAMAQNTSATGIAVTTVLAAKGEGKTADYTPLEIFRSAKKSKTVIIGDVDLDNDMYNRLKRRNIVYINREHPSGKERLTMEIKDMIPPKQMENARKSFLLRHDISALANAPSLTEMLLEPKYTELKDANFITNLEPESMKHTERTARSAMKNRLLGDMTRS